MLVPRLLRAAAPVLALAACSSLPAPLQAVSSDGVHLDPHDDPRARLAAWSACKTKNHAAEHLTLCMEIGDDLRDRRHERIDQLYDHVLASLDDSCERAAAAVTTVEGLLGPVTLDDGTVLPPWPELRHDGKTPGSYLSNPRERSPRWDPLLQHATTLLRCGDGPSLGRLYEVHARGLYAETTRQSSDQERARTTTDFVEYTAGWSPHEAFALLDRGQAPARLARVLASKKRPDPCPVSAEEVIRLMQHPSGDRRIMGCHCTNVLPASSQGTAAAARARLIAYDAESSTRASAHPSRTTLIDRDTSPLALPILLPLEGLAHMVGSLQDKDRGTETYHPVREACARALPFREQRIPRTSPSIEITGAQPEPPLPSAPPRTRPRREVSPADSRPVTLERFALTFQRLSDGAHAVLVTSTDEQGEPDGVYCQSTLGNDPRLPSSCRRGMVPTPLTEEAVETSMTVRRLRSLTVPSAVRYLRLYELDVDAEKKPSGQPAATSLSTGLESPVFRLRP